MIALDFRDQGVVVTGGTRGLGKAIAKAFARTGATVFVTHRWGSVDEAVLAREFDAAGLTAPVIVESDASDRDATFELLRLVRARVPRLRAIVSNVAFSKVVSGLDELKKSSLDLSLGYSAWPVVDLVQAARVAFDRFPRYVIGVSGDGADVCYDGYDLAGASKAVLETLCRYLAVRLKRHGVRVNVIRPGALDTESTSATFGDGSVATVRERFPEIVLDPDRVADACVALASGLLDAVTGQAITVDEGWSLVGPMAFLSPSPDPFQFPDDDAGLR